MRANLLKELILIGLITVIVGFVSTRLLSNNQWPPLDNPKLGIMLLNYFVIGASLHYIFEVSGANEKFCKLEF
jgi:uncharacterized membrane protein